MTAISTTRAVERCERLAALGPAPAWWRVFALRRWLRAYRAIMALDISEMAEMLREVYTDEKLRELATAPNPLLAIPIVERPESRWRWVDPIDHQQAAAAMTPEELARRNSR